ncbi:MAG: SDR family NAD(P)-dependent oxidoreductase [archaeon]|nr:SDR family NAD(P)-dependent oxidoreductase [archaeon]
MKAKGIEKVLRTGGAGFIGSHTVDLLVEKGYYVKVLDNLEPQVHGDKGIPEYLNKNIDFIKGDVRDKELMKDILQDVDAVIHLAAMVGVTQSMYQIEHYIDVNTKGTSVLLDLIANGRHNLKKIVVASSMSIYGEGRYHCQRCKIDFYPSLRDEEQLKKGIWDHLCPNCHSFLVPLPTDENKPSAPMSIYAMSKRHQEEMCLLIGRTYGIPTVALRYFNVYGSRQSLSNPYTGACAIFSSRIMMNKPPIIFEDGHQVRDFIHVKDVAMANLKALVKNRANYSAINIGTGMPASILKLAEILIEIYNSNLKPRIIGLYRVGDIRHCFAETKKAEELLDFTPNIGLKEGLIELSSWVRTQRLTIDIFDKALKELKEKHLLSSS